MTTNMTKQCEQCKKKDLVIEMQKNEIDELEMAIWRIRKLNNMQFIRRFR
jgi:hypothetical protein